MTTSKGLRDYYCGNFIIIFGLFSGRRKMVGKDDTWSGPNGSSYSRGVEPDGVTRMDEQ